MISFTVPGAPVAKGRARATMVQGRARLYTPDKTASYEGKAAYMAKQAMAGAHPLTGPVALSIRAVFAIPTSWTKKRLAAHAIRPEWVIKKPDADNIGKIVADSLNGVCFVDDCQVASMVTTKIYGAVPCVEVSVWGLEA
jgi:Holliday junction resolvase RusA-like endonuclease